jgi:hypothetical protein
MKRQICLVAILSSFLVLAAPSALAQPTPTHVTLASPVASFLSLNALEQPKPPPVDVDVDVHKGDRVSVSPVWLAIGAIGLVVLILLIAMAMRGRETTVVRQ